MVVDTQKDRQTGGKTDRQKDRQTERRTDKDSYKRAPLLITE